MKNTGIKALGIDTGNHSHALKTSEKVEEICVCNMEWRGINGDPENDCVCVPLQVDKKCHPTH